MSRIKLEDFNKNLEKFIKNPMKSIAKDDTLFEIIYAILYKMAELTITDTAQSRYLVISKFAQKYNKSYSDLNEQYNYWKNSNRSWGSPDSTMTEKLENKSYKMDLSIEDDALYAQEVYMRPPSDRVPGRDNSKFKTGHITYISDMINSGNYGVIEKLDIKKIIDQIYKDIEKDLFK